MCNFTSVFLKVKFSQKNGYPDFKLLFFTNNNNNNKPYTLKDSACVITITYIYIITSIFYSLPVLAVREPHSETNV